MNLRVSVLTITTIAVPVSVRVLENPKRRFGFLLVPVLNGVLFSLKKCVNIKFLG